MPEATKRGRKRAANTKDAAESNGRSTVEDQADVVQDQAADQSDRGSGEGGDQRVTLTSELRDTVRDTAIEILRPVVRNATKTVAKAAVTKGPDLVKDRISEAGGAGELAKNTLTKGGGVAGGLASKLGDSPAGGLVSKLTGGGDDEDEDGEGGKKPTGHGRGRRLPVQEYVDVAVSIDVAYDQYTQFEEFPNFMHRVEKVEQKDDSTLMWHENIWGVRRSWEAEIVEQTPNERIVWRSTGGPEVVGVVTFHSLSDRLTRVYVNMDFQPKGLFEKTASGFRMSRRALRSDLMRFKAFTEMRDEPTGTWRGMIEDGEVTEPEEMEEETEARDEEEPQDVAEDEESEEDEEEPEAEEEPEEEMEAEEEPEDEEEPEEEMEAEEEPEDEEPEEKPKKAPARRRRAAPKSKASKAKKAPKAKATSRRR